MKWLYISLVLVTVAVANPGFTSRVHYPMGPLKVEMINFEQPRDKPYLIVHFNIRNPDNEDHRCDWRQLIALEREDKSTMSSNYDVLVDSGGGLTRATGPFLVPKKGKVKASLLFVLAPGDLPGRLQVPDGRFSTPIEARGKARWNKP